MVREKENDLKHKKYITKREVEMAKRQDIVIFVLGIIFFIFGLYLINLSDTKPFAIFGNILINIKPTGILILITGIISVVYYILSR